jgi:hypothetical protein
MVYTLVQVVSTLSFGSIVTCLLHTQSRFAYDEFPCVSMITRCHDSNALYWTGLHMIPGGVFFLPRKQFWNKDNIAIVGSCCESEVLSVSATW